MKIRELLSEPARWTKRALARDGRFREVDPQSRSARCWCIVGAAMKCYEPDKVVMIREKLQAYLGMYSGDWQDAPERTFEEVRQLVEDLDI